MPPPRDASGRDRRPRLPVGLRWKDYSRTGAVCGHQLPQGLRESDRLPEPIVTPATKAQSGHDENIDGRAAADLVGAERWAEVEAVALALYRFGAAHAEARGIILADTKFELGVDHDGTLVLGDEALTPSSNFVSARMIPRASACAAPKR